MDEKRQTVILDKLKDVKISGLDGYRLDRLLFNASGNAVEATFADSLRDCAKRLICDSFVLACTDRKSSLLLVSYDYKRADHQKSWQSIRSIFSDYSELKVEDAGFSCHRICKPSQIICSFKLLFSTMKAINSVAAFKERLLLAGRLVELIRLRQALDNSRVTGQVSLMFFDGGSYENLITQYLQKKGTVTVTMQHGQPVFHGLDTDRVNQTMILNFSSDYIIVTGEFSKKQFMLGNVNENSIKVLGSWRTIIPYKDISSKTFSVFLDCPTMPNARIANQELISIAEKLAERLDMSYLVKLHPQDKIYNYCLDNVKKGSFLAKEKTLNDALGNIEFAILHTSGVYVDILAAGVKAFCLVLNDNFPLVEVEMDKFADLNGILSKLDIWRKETTEFRKKYIERLVEYYLSPVESQKRHFEFIRNLIDS